VQYVYFASKPGRDVVVGFKHFCDLLLHDEFSRTTFKRKELLTLNGWFRKPLHGSLLAEIDCVQLCDIDW
jgi:hypothetical protein